METSVFVEGVDNDVSLAGVPYQNLCAAMILNSASIAVGAASAERGHAREWWLDESIRGRRARQELADFARCGESAMRDVQKELLAGNYEKLASSNIWSIGNRRVSAMSRRIHALGMTSRDVAEAVGLSPSAVSQVCNGRRDTTKRTRDAVVGFIKKKEAEGGDTHE